LINALISIVLLFADASQLSKNVIVTINKAIPIHLISIDLLKLKKTLHPHRKRLTCDRLPLPSPAVVSPDSSKSIGKLEANL
jgi:hypothetical protein